MNETDIQIEWQGGIGDTVEIDYLMVFPRTTQLPFLDASGAGYFSAISANAAWAPCWISSGVRSLVWVASIQL
jgi:hypothetical protein